MPSRFTCAVLIALGFLLPAFGQGPVLPPPSEKIPPVPGKPPPLPPPEENLLPEPSSTPPAAGHPVYPDTGHSTPPCLEKTIPQTQILLVPREQAAILPDWKLREVEVGRIPEGPVLKFHEEKQYVTELRIQPREVEQQVVVTESQPVTVTDPCTGHCRTEYRPCQVVKTVKVKVYETVPVQTQVIVRVPTLEPGQELTVKALQLDQTTTAVIDRRFEPMMTFNEVKVVVPLPTCQHPH